MADAGDEGKIDTQTRMDPGASCMLASGGALLSAWVADELNRIPEQGLSEAEERTFADLVCKAK